MPSNTRFKDQLESNVEKPSVVSKSKKSRWDGYGISKLEIARLNRLVKKGNDHNGNGYNVEHRVKNVKFGTIFLSYHDQDAVRAQVRSTMENKLETEDSIEKALLEVPAGGRITLSTYRSSIKTANPSNFLYVIRKNGEEVLRESGEHQIPNHYGKRDDLYNWYSINSIFSPVTAEDGGFELFVVDQVVGLRDEFVVRTGANFAE